MTAAAPEAIAIARTLDAVMREDRGRLLAALISRTRDFQLAEDALQEAATSALAHWGRAGLPASPQGWLLKVALRKAIDRLRGASRESRKTADLARLARDEAEEDPEMIADERLRLIFTCCHPSLEPKSRVALTLRTICGLTTAEIARAFLDEDATMGQRLSRAKAKIAAARIPFAVPEPEDLAERLGSVLTVIYLIFNAGYTVGPGAGRDLCEEAIFLARLLDRLCPDEPETEGCLALMLLTHARRAARTGADGQSLPVQEQDRRLWDHAMMAEGVALVNRAMARGRVGANQIKAAIAVCHSVPATPDWPGMRALYDTLQRLEPTPVIRLNRAVALAETGDLAGALDELALVAPDLASYQPYHAVMADLLARGGRKDEARAVYDRAIDLAPSAADAAFLIARRGAL